MTNLKALLKNDRWIVPFLKNQHKGLLWSIILSFMTIFAAAGLMFISGYLISRAAQRPDNILLIYVPIVLTRGFGIARPIFRYAQRLVSHNWVLQFVSESRRRLYERVASSASKIRSKLQTGEVLSLLADDLDQLQNLYLRTLFPLGAGLVLYLVVIIGIGIFSWQFVIWWLIMLTVIMIIVPVISLLTNRSRIQRQKHLQAKLYADATDAILGLQDWISSGRQDDLVAHQGRAMKELARVKNKSMQFGWWRDFLIQLLALLLVITTLFWANSVFKNNQMAINYIAAFTLAILPLVESFTAVNQGVSEASFYEDSITRLNALPELVNKEPIEQQINGTDLKLINVTFSYDHKTVIDNLNLTVQKGEKIALLGRSGSGKTTLLKLITGDIKPDLGSITIGEQHINKLQNQLSKIVAILDQQSYLFDTTILNNVKMGNINASDDQVKQAINQAGLQPLIDSLPMGYQTQMQEAGKRFSGGEQQRFALARVLLQDSPIVILDEPTVSLDPKTEHEVLSKIFEVLKNRTIIWVTHHLTGIESVDHVYFLKNGQFSLADTPKQLKQNSEHFKQLLAMDDFQ